IRYPLKNPPLAIGIMRQFEYERDGFTVLEYQFERFVKGNSSVRVMTDNHNILSNKLVVFTVKYDENEQNLLFYFVIKTGPCWEIRLEIAQYLPLNDAISAFLIRILFLLQNIQWYNPYDPFIKTILPKISKEKMISLQLNEHLMYSHIEEDLLCKFREVVSISLHNLSSTYRIFTYMKMCLNLIRV
ncbi:unnamed protein product, partial [Rotaria sp. Silwood2]